MTSARYSFWVLGSICVFFQVATLPAQAQVIEDATLPTPTVVTQNGTTNIITGGTQAGTNLFHSFGQFSIPIDNTASFWHNPGIINIISRVTGSSASNINGLIEVLQTSGNPSSANFFLINPNGIVFGPKASLNIGGSFVSSTANSIKFSDGTEFSATNPKATPPTLTISVPLGLQFGVNPKGIVNQSQFVANRESVGLKVQPGKTLVLVGGELELPGGRLTAPDGRIELGSVASPGLVSFTPTATGFALGYEGIQNFQDTRLSQRALVDVSGDSGGDITVTAKKLLVQDGSQIGSASLVYGRGGMLRINASDAVEIIGASAVNPSQIYSQMAMNSGGIGSDVKITTKQLIIGNGAQISSNTRGQGQGGNVIIDAADFVEVSGFASVSRNAVSSIFATTQSAGNAGSLTINTQRLLLQQGGQISSGTASFGRGGNITVNALDSVTAIGTSRTAQDSGRSSGLFAQTSARGTAGELVIKTGQLRVLDGAQISSITTQAGSAGNLTVKADSVELAGIALTSDGQVIATNELPVIFSGLLSSTNRNSTGNGATLTIDTRRLSVRDGAIAQTSTLGSGDAGNLIIKASDFVEVIGTAKGGLFPSSILAASGGVTGAGFIRFPQATGKGGNVSITTGNLTVQDGGQIAASSINPTNNAKGAGNLQIQANNIFLDNQGKLNVETASGTGGEINLKLQDLLLLRRNSQISATAGVDGKGGDGGNIQIEAPFIVAVPSENSDIRANAYTGDGGKIDLITKGIFGIERQVFDTQQSDVTASSQFGTNGIININSPDVDPTRGAVPLPTNVVDVSNQISQACNPGSRQRANSFVSTGRGGIPSSPTDLLLTDAVLADWITLTNQPEQGRDATMGRLYGNSHPTKIVEAQGWVVDADGSIVLVAQAPSDQEVNMRSPQPSLTCPTK